MKRIAVILVVMCLAVTSVPGFVAAKGANEKALEHASDEAIFHRVGDWFATRGKSDEEKEAIISERKAKRAAKRAEKEAEKQKRIAEKEAAKAKKAAGDKMKKMKKKMK